MARARTVVVGFAGWLVLVVGGCEVGEGGEWGGSSTTGDGSCSTGQFVNVGEGSTMKPGGDCISCHASGEGPRFVAAGTVMNDYGDTQGCEGIEGVTVKITDANGQVHTLQTNSSGNFFTSQAIATPYTVELSYMGDTRAMASAQTDTDCASCHTANGENGAPGRILVP